MAPFCNLVGAMFASLNGVCYPNGVGDLNGVDEFNGVGDLNGVGGRILAPFWSLVGAMFATKRPPRRPKSRPRCLQKASGRRLGARSRPRGAQEAPRPPPGLDFRPLQASILDNFGSKF